MELTSSEHARLSRRRRMPNYLPFGYHTTMCLAIFFLSYATFLMCLVPLLRPPRTPNFSGVEVGSNGKPLLRVYTHAPEHHYDALKPAIDPILETYEHLPFVAEELAEAVQKRFDNYIEERGFGDSIGNVRKKKTSATPAPIRKKRRPPPIISYEKKKDASTTSTSVAAVEAPPGKPTGFMVLGMHRSGTSILSGLLVEGMGYFAGPKMGSDSFFERLDVVLQNDLFMHGQKMSWSSSKVDEYDSERAWHDHKLGKVGFHKGENALKFFNDPDHAKDHAPYLQKDPRMCITLKTWLPLFHNAPVVLFTYRHPLQVARSLLREKKLQMDHGFQIWIIYNMRAIQNSAGLCRVVTSHDAVLADPMTEIQRIADELTTKCGVPKPPRGLTQDVVVKFADPNSHLSTESSVEKKQGIGNDCAHNHMQYDEDPDHQGYIRERALYQKAMQIYCDIQSGEAFKEEYVWPEIASGPIH
jgi:hypothetical protein